MATYFVKSSGGSDANSGLSDALAWATVSKVNGFAFSAGDIVQFKRASLWREKIALSVGGASDASRITVQDYDTGAKPTFRGSDLAAGWTLDAGNVWFISLGTDPNIIWFDGTRGIEELSKAALTASNEWFFDSGAARLYVFSTSDPDTAFTAPGIEFGVRDSALDTNSKNHVTYKNLIFEHSRGATAGVGLVWVRTNPVNITVEFCEVRSGFGFGLTTSGASSSNVHIKDNLIEGFGDSNMTMNQVDNLDYHIYRNEARHGGWRVASGAGLSIRLKSGEVFENLCWDNGLVGLGAGQHHGIYINNGSHPVSPADVQVYSNTTRNQPNGSGLVAKSNCHMRDNLSYDNSHDGLTLGEVNSGNLVTVYIYRNRFYGNGKYGISQNLPPISGTMAIRAYHNTLYDNGWNGGRAVQLDDAHAELDFRNNIFFMLTAGISPVSIVTTQTGTFIFDYNLYFRNDLTGNPVIYVGTTRTWAQWQALGKEANGIWATNPEFTNAPSDDFTLVSTSPAIDAGVAIPDINDGFLGAQPDMGALEFVPTGAQPAELVPVSTVAAGEWLNEASSGANLHSSLADAVPTTWIQSATSPAGTPAKVGLTDTPTPTSTVTLEVECRQV